MDSALFLNSVIESWRNFIILNTSIWTDYKDKEELKKRERVSIIFQVPPSKWSLRGDPYLWRELETHFSKMFLPCSEEHFLKEVYFAFEQFTGSELGAEDYIHTPHYDHGGMSGGMVCSTFWLERAIPLLIRRLRQVNDGI